MQAVHGIMRTKDNLSLQRWQESNLNLPNLYQNTTYRHSPTTNKHTQISFIHGTDNHTPYAQPT